MNHIYLITGVMASGKSTVAELFAARLPRAVHLRGDAFRRMIVSGRAEMSADATPEAFDQLYLRYHISALVAGEYLRAGFDVVLQDNYYGQALTDVMNMLDGLPVRVVVLCPDAEAVKRREAGRGKVGYSGFAVESLHQMFLRETPRIGYWIDSSNQTPEETVEAILAHFRIGT
jgi:chloramphenicol 3-O-phosphotransferase